VARTPAPVAYAAPSLVAVGLRSLPITRYWDVEEVPARMWVRPVVGAHVQLLQGAQHASELRLPRSAPTHGTL